MILYVVIGAVVGLTLLALLLRAQQNLEQTASQEAQQEIESLKASLVMLTKRIEHLEIIASEGETQILDNSLDLIGEADRDPKTTETPKSGRRPLGN